MMHTQKSWEDNNESQKVTAGQNLLAFAVSQHISDSFGPQTQLHLSRAKSLTDGKINTDRTLACGLKTGARD